MLLVPQAAIPADAASAPAPAPAPVPAPPSPTASAPPSPTPSASASASISPSAPTPAGPAAAGSSATSAAPTLDPTLPRWRALRIQAAAQAKANDTAGLHATLEALAPLMPGSPRVTYNLAATEARLGRRAVALQHLQQLADAGLEYDLAADDDFAGLAGDPDFRALRKRLAPGAQRTGAPRTLIALPADDAIPEAIAQGPDGRWWVGSVRHCDVRDVTLPSGKLAAAMASPAPAPATARAPATANANATARAPARAVARGAPSRRGHAARPRASATRAPIHLPAPVFGLAWDAPRGVLWVTVAAVPQGGDCGDTAAWPDGRTALLGLDVSRGGKLWRQVESPLPGVLGDLTIGPDGTVYVSESLHGALFRLRPGRASLERLDPPGELASPQQPVLAADGRTLLVPDYCAGWRRSTSRPRRRCCTGCPPPPACSRLASTAWCATAIH